MPMIIDPADPQSTIWVPDSDPRSGVPTIDQQLASGRIPLGGVKAYESLPANFSQTIGRSPADAATLLYGAGHAEFDPLQGVYTWITDAGNALAGLFARGGATYANHGGGGFLNDVKGFLTDTGGAGPILLAGIGQAIYAGVTASAATAAPTLESSALGAIDTVRPAFGDSFISGIAEDAGITSGNAANFAQVSGSVPGAAGELFSWPSLPSLPSLPRTQLVDSILKPGGLASKAADFLIAPAAAATLAPGVRGYSALNASGSPYGLNAAPLPVNGSSELPLFALIAAGVVIAVALKKKGG